MNIDDMANLKDNWDSYGAAPINPKAIEIAKTINNILVGFTAVPTPNGGVQLEKHTNKDSIEIEISVESKGE